jgi:hypothetical protein
MAVAIVSLVVSESRASQVERTSPALHLEMSSAAIRTQKK